VVPCESRNTQRRAPRNSSDVPNGNQSEYHEFVTLDGWDPRLEKKAGEEYLKIPDGVGIEELLSTK